MSEYLPQISWETLIKDVELTSTPFTYRCKVAYLNPNDPGNGELGDTGTPKTDNFYVVDYLGRIYEIKEVINAATGYIEIYDLTEDPEYDGPYTDKEAYVYQSKTGHVILTQAQRMRLHSSAIDMIWNIENNILGGDGSSKYLVREVTQVAHGFDNDFIYYNGTIWTKAIASDASTCATHFSIYIDDDTFLLVPVGEIDSTGMTDSDSTGLIASEYYFLDQSVAGKVTPTKPTSGIIQSVLMTNETNYASISIQEPYDISDVGGGSGIVNFIDLEDVQSPYVANKWLRVNSTGDGIIYDDLPTYTTDDISEGSNLYFTNERVDDRVNSLLVAGTNITLNYDDTANTLTISASGGGTPAGSNSQIQFNDNNSFGASANLTWVESMLTVTGNLKVTDFGTKTTEVAMLYYNPANGDIVYGAAPSFTIPGIEEVSDADNTYSKTATNNAAYTVLDIDIDIYGGTSTSVDMILDSLVGYSSIGDTYGSTIGNYNKITVNYISAADTKTFRAIGTRNIIDLNYISTISVGSTNAAAEAIGVYGEITGSLVQSAGSDLDYLAAGVFIDNNAGNHPSYALLTDGNVKMNSLPNSIKNRVLYYDVSTKEISYGFHLRDSINGGSSTRDSNDVFDALSSYIPNPGEEIMVSGGITTNAGVTAIISSAYRFNSSTIFLYGIDISDGTYTSVGITDGSTNPVDVSLAW